jgi:cytoskeletal protein CcmA (bactofilin family)
MMAYTLNILIFAVICTVLLTIALRPAWQEWRHPSDVLALPVAANYTNEIDHFADEFREIALARMNGRTPQASQRFDVVPDLLSDMNWALVKRPLISFHPIHSSTGIVCTQALFVAGSIECGEANHFSGLYVQGNMRLGARSEIVNWAHADQAMHLESGCIALRRISSSTSIEMDTDCCFERMQAPVVRMGVNTTSHMSPQEQHLTAAKYSDINGAITQTDNLTLIRGDCTLPAGRRFVGSLIVTGRLQIGDGTEIVGNVKARTGVVVGAHAKIEGSLISEQQIQILEHAAILGPVISETVILMGTHCRLGRPLQPTTVSAENILAEAGAIAHGTVWARDLGVVWSA